MKASIRNTQIYFDIAGMEYPPNQNDKKNPVIFLLHGGPGGDHTRFKYHSLELQEIAQLVFIDHRGCGRSKKANIAEYNLENNIEDIEALRVYLGLEKICVLGASYGGMVAQGYASRYPENLDKLILVATAPSFRFIDEAKCYLQEKATSEQINFCEHLWNGTFKDQVHVNEFFNVMESLYSNNPSGLKIPKISTTWSHEVLNYAFSHFLREYDFIQNLHQILCPTLVLCGEDDWICRPSQSRKIAEMIPNSELKIFKNCGHAVATDAHEAYIQIIKEFLT